MQTKAKKLMNVLSGVEHRDFVLNTKNLKVEIRDKQPVLQLGGRFEFPMTSWALDQLSSRIYPGLRAFAKELISNGDVGVYKDTVNQILKFSDKRIQVRTFDGVAGAVVSDHYKAIDDPILFKNALTAIEGLDGFRFQSCTRTSKRTVVKVVSDEPKFSLNDGNKQRNFLTGFTLQNSEVGLGFAKLTPFLTDQECKNGMIFQLPIGDVCYMHRGERIDDSFAELKPSWNEVQMRKLGKSVEKAVARAAALDWGELTQKVIASTFRQIGSDPAKLLAVIGKKLLLTPPEVEIAQKVFRGEAKTLFGVQAAISSTAQKLEADRMLFLETVGGSLMLTTDQQWQKYNMEGMAA